MNYIFDKIFMKKLAIIVLIITCVGLSGCFGQIEEVDRFVGSWKLEEGSYKGLFGESITFYSDRSVIISNSMGAIYEVNNGTLVIKQGDGGLGLQFVYDYSFSNNYNVLTISDISKGTSSTFIKQ